MTTTTMTMTIGEKSVRITKRDIFTALLSFANGNALEFSKTVGDSAVTQPVTNDMLRDFCQNEIARLDHKSPSAEKPSKTKVENDRLRSALIEALAASDSPMSINDLCALSEFNGFSNQRMSSLLGPLVKQGAVVRTLIKKKAHYSLADSAEG